MTATANTPETNGKAATDDRKAAAAAAESGAGRRWLSVAGGAGLSAGAALLALAVLLALRGGPAWQSCLLAAAALALALPPLLIWFRFRLLASINGDEGVELPNATVHGAAVKALYNHPATHLRSKQARYGLSDFFWYLLAPAHAIHQEHVESDDVRYKLVAHATRRLCAIDAKRLREITRRHAARLLLPTGGGKGGEHAPAAAAAAAAAPWESSRSWGGSLARGGSSAGRIRTLVFPMLQRAMLEVVFGREMPDELVEAACLSAENVLNGIKATSLRDMGARRRLCDALQRVLAEGLPADDPLRALLDERISQEEWALFLQGVFLTTGVVQLSEGVTHLALALGQSPGAAEQLRREERARAQQQQEQQQQQQQQQQGSSPAGGADGPYLRHVLKEVLRVWPLFGVAHRITSADIDLDALVRTAQGGGEGGAGAGAAAAAPAKGGGGGGNVLPAGTVLCFNYPKYHHSGFGADSTAFRPERWAGLREREENYIPFGAERNRPCPGNRVSLVMMAEVAKVLVEAADVVSPIEHTRSLPCGGIACLVPRRRGGDAAEQCTGARRACLLLALRGWAAADSLSRSVRQLVFGVYMLWESRRLQLAQRYFKADYSPLDKDEPHKPCRAGQLYRRAPASAAKTD